MATVSTEPVATCLMSFFERRGCLVGGGDGVDDDPAGAVGEYGGGFIRPRRCGDSLRLTSASVALVEVGIGRVGGEMNGVITSAASVVIGERREVVVIDEKKTGCGVALENSCEDGFEVSPVGEVTV